MNTSTDVFMEVPSLTERSVALNGSKVLKKWFKNADPRNLVNYLQKFLSYNAYFFSFLEIQPFIVGTDSGSSLVFRTSSFVGAIPLRSPSTGKQIGDFVVSPRFFGRDRYGEYIEILDLLGTEISPEFADSSPLRSGRIFQPPLYLEAANFIASLERVLKQSWRKFDCVSAVLDQPQGQVDWQRYLRSEYKVEERLRFPVHKNVLSELHSEFAEIRFVFDLCKSELLSNRTPDRIRILFRARLNHLEKMLYLHIPARTSYIKIRAYDPPVVRTCKENANIILSRDFTSGTAWRVDFNDVFEKFVQHVFSRVAKVVGGKLFPNLRIQAKTSKRYAWELANLEPDAVLKRGSLAISIDAKYKSHLFNKYDASELLKEDFRRDVHQVLSYSSFSNSNPKTAIICYPAPVFEMKATVFHSNVSAISCRVLLVGVPLSRASVPESVRLLSEKVNQLENQER